jgi:hypothetical protein
MNQKHSGTGWSNLQLVGLVVVALGAAFLAYSIYNFAITPSFAGIPRGAGRGNFTVAGNFTRGNFTRGSGRSFNGISGATVVGIRDPLILRLGDILAGVFLLLLGIVTFKYGGLKKMVPKSAK